MSNVKINTDHVLLAAETVSKLNGEIRSDFENVRSAMNQLQNDWEGLASVNAFQKYNEMESSYGESRYQVLNNYVLYLHQQAGEGYEDTENINKTLADAFK